MQSLNLQNIYTLRPSLDSWNRAAYGENKLVLQMPPKIHYYQYVLDMGSPFIYPAVYTLIKIKSFSTFGVHYAECNAP